MGSSYQGELKDGKKHGRGTKVYQQGMYDGEWENDKKHGEGTYIWNNGDKYVGSFKSNRKDGKGIFYFKSGNRYEGEYKEDKKNGIGTLYYSDGTQYSGEWVDDKPEGYGTLTFANGDKYEGHFRNGRKDGLGTFYWTSSGNKYEGFWKNKVREGKGTFYCSNGDKYFGCWMNDVPYGLYQIHEKDSVTISNVQSDLMKEGNAISIHKNDNARYFEVWKDGVKDEVKSRKWFYDWNVDEAASWIEKLIDKEAGALFKQHKISGSIIQKLDENKLQMIGIKAVGDILLILEEVEKLKHEIRDAEFLLLEHCSELHKLWFPHDQRPSIPSPGKTPPSSPASSPATFQLVVVERGSEEFNELEDKLKADLQGQHQDYNAKRFERKLLPITFSLKSATRIVNNPLERKFEEKVLKLKEQGRNAEEVRVRRAYHGTKSQNLESICRHGLLKVGNAKNPSPATDGGWFGDPKFGVYVSKYLEYTLKYTRRPLEALEVGDTAKILMLKVVTGKTHHVTQLSSGMRPTPNYDSHSSPNFLEWFLFDEDQTCPTYLLEVKAIENTRIHADDGYPVYAEIPNLDKSLENLSISVNEDNHKPVDLPRYVGQ